MALLEQVTQMKSQGMNDNQISENLQQQGFAPREIQDALGQSQVKSAVIGGEQQEMINAPQEQQYESQENYAPQEGGYGPQTGYSEGGNYGNYSGAETGGTDNIIEISEQVY